MPSILRRSVRVALLAPALALAVFAPSALGVGSSVKLAGPHANRLGSFFTYRLTGFAAGGADHVVAWEQLYPRPACAPSYAAESARTFLPLTYGLMPAGDEALTPGRTFSTNLSFHAVNPGSHALCVYLISVETGRTFAHAKASWTNS